MGSMIPEFPGWVDASISPVSAEDDQPVKATLITGEFVRPRNIAETVIGFDIL
jgi:hypothetical protein